MRTFVIAAALVAAATAPALGQDVYGKVFGGVAFGNEHDITAQIVDEDLQLGVFDTKTGYVVGGALGVSPTKFFSLEAEVAHRSNSVDSAVIGGEPFDTTGNLKSLSFMANGILSTPADFGPYAGAGAGAARIGGEGDHDMVFAYQAFGGLKKNFGPQTVAAVEYRYFNADEASLADSAGVITTEYDSHSVSLVLSRKF